ncbi:MAG: hypothetical protein CK547_01575 [Chitinophagaceae bacterium]|nr:MAG: hypothetical protein CK547_01575 [Chitinophagaceae bacterium]
MFNSAIRSINQLIVLLLMIFLSSIAGCKKNLTIREPVYAQNFETNSTENITAVTGWGQTLENWVHSFHGTKVLGEFNNTLVTIKVYRLPPHNMVYVGFDFYAHDAWEGNKKSVNGIVDVWNIRVNNQYQLSTTFSNTPNNKQSYPDWIGVVIPAPPRGNSLDTLLPGVCTYKDRINGSSKYRISFTRPHKDSVLVLQLNDALQGNTCDKSWSIDNLIVEAITN